AVTSLNPIQLSPTTVGAGLALVLLLVLGYLVALQQRLNGGRIALLIGAGVVAWFAVGAILRWSLLIGLLPFRLLLFSVLVDLAMAPGMRGRRPAQTLLLVLSAALLISVATLALAGRGGGDPATLLSAVVVLLACAACWALADLVRRQRFRLLPAATALVTT